MRQELDEMSDVLLGYSVPPMTNGVMTLMEVAEAYHARALYLTIKIQRAEADGYVTRGSKVYRFRTGELRSFLEMTSKAIELGSRRLTAAQLDHELRSAP